MHKFKQHKQLYRSLALIIIFTLLAISITKNIIEIYTSSTPNPTVVVPILMYHHVKNTGLGKDVISPYEFESDLKYFTENNYTTITIKDLIDYVNKGKDLPEKPIILSFDDGYYNTYKYVYPLLQQYNMKIVLSVIGKVTDDFSKVVDNNVNFAHMTWNEINEMQSSGLVEIQNHSYNLHKICKGRYGCSQLVNETFSQYEDFIEEDIIKLQDRINEMVNITPNTFTYPYGKYNNNTDLIIKDIGFQATLTVTYGVNLVTEGNPECLYDLKRICRAHDQGVKRLLKNAMETLKYIDY